MTFRKSRFWSLVLAYAFFLAALGIHPIPRADATVYQVAVTPKFKAFEPGTGNPLASGKLYTYLPGTTALTTTYKDYAGGSLNTNPIILDANGECDLFYAGYLKLALYDAGNVLVWTKDNIPYGPFPRYYDNNAFSDNLTLYGNDIITGGPWVDVRRHNTALTGVAIQNAIDNATAGDTVMLNKHATYSISSPIYITKKVVLDLNGSTLSAAGVTDSIIQVGNGAWFAGPVVIKNGNINGSGGADSGIKITVSPSYRLSINNINVSYCNKGLNFYGAAGLSMTSIAVNDLGTNFNNYGVYLDKAGNTASFAQFTFNNPSLADNVASIYSVNGYNGIVIIGGDTQPKDGGDGIILDNSAITLIEHYVETYYGETSLTLTNSSVASIFGGVAYGYSADNTSTVAYFGFMYPNAVGRTFTPSITGHMSDVKSTDTYKWGNPYLPDKESSGGATVHKGMRFTDDYGVVWTATTGGLAASAARWSAMDGRIVIPISYNTYGNATIFWHPEEDFIITDLSLVITDNWVGGTSVSVYGYPSYPTDNTISYYIGTTQGGVGNLISGNILTASQETSSDNALVGGKERFISGVQIGSSSTDKIKPGLRWGTAGTWTAGTGYIVIRGYYLKYN